MLSFIAGIIGWLIGAALLVAMFGLLGRSLAPHEPPEVPDENKRRGFEVLPPK